MSDSAGAISGSSCTITVERNEAQSNKIITYLNNIKITIKEMMVKSANKPDFRFIKHRIKTFN